MRCSRPSTASVTARQARGSTSGPPPADRLTQLAAANAAAGRGRSAAGQYLRGSLYYSLATYSADGMEDPTLFASLWEKHRAAWDRFVDLGEFGGAVAERIEIPYEGTTLPGYFFRCRRGRCRRGGR